MWSLTSKKKQAFKYSKRNKSFIHERIKKPDVILKVYKLTDPIKADILAVIFFIFFLFIFFI